MESAEHAWIGDQVTLHFEAGDVSAAGTPLFVGPGSMPGTDHVLTYGQTIALGGDFYGMVGAPISTSADPQAAFTAAFNTLTTYWRQIPQILEIMGEEIQAVKAAQAAGQEPSTAYAALGDSLSVKWNAATGGGTVTDWLPMGRYLLLAAENWDHFTTYAVKAYQAGHGVAMQYAATIRSSGIPAEAKAVRLQHAYALNAFADHFLTDLFSAGHLRAPRRELYAQVTTPVPGFSGSLGSLLARCMHDEDSHFGLKVTNAHGDSWTAYGDKRLLDGVSKGNRDIVVRATQASVDDVWAAYSGAQPAYRALSLIPDLVRVADVSTKENFSPLFRSGDPVTRRTDVTNRNDFSWTADWWGWSTFAAIQATESRSYQHVRCYRLADGAFLGWLGSGTNSYVVLVAEEQDAHGLVWQFEGDDLYLRKDTSPQDRYLGVGAYSYADWGLAVAGGWRDPVLYNADETISLKADPKRKLYLYTDSQVCWSNGETDLPFLRVELPLDPEML